ncbi:porin [Piscinibacter sp. HJYY11]|uniref:porin n=1 Tax=Piscinibacter sp. HJYY11 TaxID=2801333 RepID=UPI00191CB857|nr:porin [Piscinibacter sp. HJYY11]MBL0729960.1 porin [Piscinibacter sp. HJYY11]
MKTRIALACASLAASLSQVAHAQTPAGVTLYGRMDMAIAYQTRLFSSGVVVGGGRWYADSGGSNGSRWGLRGSEDLGGGTRALFVMESGLQADTGVIGQGGRIFGRQVYIGLDGGFGRLTVGRQYTPWFDVLSTSDPFGNNLVGNSGNVAHANPRADNAIVYGTPSVAGLTAQGMLALGERNGSSAAGRQVNLALKYQRGPLWIGAAHARQGSADEVPPASGSFRANVTARFSIVGASYDFGVVKLFGHYAVMDDMNPTIQAAPTPVAGAEGSSWLLGASAPLFGGSLMASVVSLDDQRALDRDARMLAAGYTYPLSKRTMLYGAWARMINRNGGTLTVNTPSYPGAGEVQFQAGLSHVF